MKRILGSGSESAPKRPPDLKRDQSDIIPASIPTQEALRNLERYRSATSETITEHNHRVHVNDDDGDEHIKQSCCSTGAVCDDASPIVPSPTSLSSSLVLRPIRRGQPLVLSPQPSKRYPALTPSATRFNEDDDPIVDFDDDLEEETAVVRTEQGTSDDPVQSMSMGSLSSLPPGQSKRRTLHSTVAPLQSPTAKFILPETSYQASRSSHVVPHPSPSKRLRPISEIPRPIAPIHSLQQPRSLIRGHGSPSRRQTKERRTGLIQSAVSTSAITRSPTTPTRRISDIAKSLRILQPPEPLGPKLLEIAEEEQAQELRAQERDIGSDHDSSSSVATPEGGSSPRHSAAAPPLLHASFSSPSFTASFHAVSSSSKSTTSVNLVQVKKEEPSSQSNLHLSILNATAAPEQPEQPPLLLEKSTVSSRPPPQQLTPEVPSVIPLPNLVLEYAPRLTPIDHIKWPPAKEGRFHVLGLVLSIGPVEQVANRTGPQAGQHYGKRLITVCDQSATSFKVVLWRDRCDWGDLFKSGDVVLLTDLQTKEFRNKVTGNSSSWSRMSRLDGTLLESYSGNPTIVSFLKVLSERRQILALDILDRDKGIASDPSLYITQPMASIHQPIGNMEGIAPAIAVSSRSSTSSGVDPKPFIPILPSSISGTSIRASVVYKMLLSPEDDRGWEIGAIMANGRLVKIQGSNATSWIGNASPGRLMHFFGTFVGQEDVFRIDASTKVPEFLSDHAWGSNSRRVDPHQFTTIRSLRNHKYMGDATIDGYILAASFPDVYGDNDRQSQEIYGFIKCYCTGCASAAVSSPQNPSILFCPHCHLDPQRRAKSTLEWMYPSFELSLGDKPRMGANLSSECLQVRCQMQTGDQVFPSVPAWSWMQDEEGFWRARRRWQRLVELMSDGSEHQKRPGYDKEDDGGGQRQRVRLELRVGINLMTKALNIEYL